MYYSASKYLCFYFLIFSFKTFLIELPLVSKYLLTCLCILQLNARWTQTVCTTRRVWAAAVSRRV